MIDKLLSQVMWDYLCAILLGILEGITEFIPISSTGHLILVGDLLQFHSSNADTFNIAIQLGAILAVVWLYWDVFKRYLSPKHWLSRQSMIILVAILPAMILGLFFYESIKGLFISRSVAINLGIGGLVMLAVEHLIRPTPNTTSLDDITFKQAFIVGLCQCASLLPGTSRSGSTIVGGLLAKLDYKTAASFSFIIAVPVMIAAVGYDLFKGAGTLTQHDLTLIGIGFVVSFMVAWASILTFLKLLTTWKLTPFALYRIALSAILLIWIL